LCSGPGASFDLGRSDRSSNLRFRFGGTS
jgi:hypothetical protein